MKFPEEFLDGLANGWKRSPIDDPKLLPFIPVLLEPEPEETADQYILRGPEVAMRVCAALTNAILKVERNGVEDPDFKYGLATAKASLGTVKWFAEERVKEIGK